MSDCRAVWIAALAVILSGRDAGAACLLNESFEDGFDGAAPAGWTLVASGAGTTFAVADNHLSTPRLRLDRPIALDSPAREGTNALRFFDLDGLVALEAYRDHAPASVVSYELWMWIPVRFTNGSFDVHFDDPGTAEPDVRIYFEFGSVQQLWWSAAPPTGAVLIGSLEAQRWYRVRVVTDAVSDTGEIYLYSDTGALLASGTGLAFNRKSVPATTLGRVVLKTSSTTTVRTYLDGLAVSDSGGCPASPSLPVPAPSRPMADARFPQTAPTLEWAMAPGAYDFKVELAEDRSFTTGVIRRESRSSPIGFTIGPGSGSYSLSDGGLTLSDDRVYWWKVAAYQGGSHSNWSAPRAFTVNAQLNRSDWYQRDGWQFASGILSDVDLIDTTRPFDNLRIAAGGGTNYALASQGSTASASSSQLGGPPSAAIDGDPVTDWKASVSPSDLAPEWFRVDLGTTRVISGFEFVLSGFLLNSLPYRFQVRTYGDATCAAVQNTYPSPTTDFLNRQTRWRFALDVNESVRCVELRIKEVSGGPTNWVPVIEEFRVWDAGPVPAGTWTGASVAYAGFESPKTDWSIFFWNGRDTAGAGLTVKLQTSPDGVVWADSAKVSTSANGVFTISDLDPLGADAYIRPVITFTKGSTATIEAVSAATLPGPTAAGLSLVAREAGDAIELRWWDTQPAPTDRYRVHRQAPGEDALAPIPGAIVAAQGIDAANGEFTFRDDRASGRGEYRYRIERVRSDGSSDYSDLATVTLEEDASRVTSCRTAGSGDPVPAIAGIGALALLACLWHRR